MVLRKGATPPVSLLWTRAPWCGSKHVSGQVETSAFAPNSRKLNMLKKMTSSTLPPTNIEPDKGLPLNAKMVLQQPPVMFHVNWWVASKGPP